MKFKKFVKSLASTGMIYRYGSQEWLASPTVYMAIPDGTRSVTATGVEKMPSAIASMIDQIGNTQPATLTKAIMPYPDGAIKDCLRQFTTPGGEFSMLITNDDWSLIEKSDFCEILYAYDMDEDQMEVKALLVKRYPAMPDDDDELVGIIFPVDNEF